MPIIFGRRIDRIAGNGNRSDEKAFLPFRVMASIGTDGVASAMVSKPMNCSIKLTPTNIQPFPIIRHPDIGGVLYASPMPNQSRGRDGEQLDPRILTITNAIRVFPGAPIPET